MIICVLKRILHKKSIFFYKRILEVGAPRLLLKKTRASKAENITVSVDHFRDTSGCVSGSTDHFGDTSGSAITLGYIRMTFRADPMDKQQCCPYFIAMWARPRQWAQHGNKRLAPSNPPTHLPTHKQGNLLHWTVQHVTDHKIQNN